MKGRTYNIETDHGQSEGTLAEGIEVLALCILTDLGKKDRLMSDILIDCQILDSLTNAYNAIYRTS